MTPPSQAFTGVHTQPQEEIGALEQKTHKATRCVGQPTDQTGANCVSLHTPHATSHRTSPLDRTYEPKEQNRKFDFPPVCACSTRCEIGSRLTFSKCSHTLEGTVSSASSVPLYHRLSYIRRSRFVNNGLSAY